MAQSEKKLEKVENENQNLRSEVRGLVGQFDDQLEARVAAVEIAMVSNMQLLEARISGKRKRDDEEDQAEGGDEDTLLLKKELEVIELSDSATHDNSLLVSFETK